MILFRELQMRLAWSSPMNALTRLVSRNAKATNIDITVAATSSIRTDLCRSHVETDYDAVLHVSVS